MPASKPWTTEEQLRVIWSLVERPVKWDQIYFPPGRTKRAIEHLLTNMNDRMKEYDERVAAENGEVVGQELLSTPMSTPMSTPKGTPKSSRQPGDKKRGRSGDTEPKTPSKRAAFPKSKRIKTEDGLATFPSDDSRDKESD